MSAIQQDLLGAARALQEAARETLQERQRVPGILAHSTGPTSPEKTGGDILFPPQGLWEVLKKKLNAPEPLP